MVIPRKSPASNQRHQRQLSHKVRWAWDDGRGGRGGEEGGKNRSQSSYQWIGLPGAHENGYDIRWMDEPSWPGPMGIDWDGCTVCLSVVAVGPVVNAGRQCRVPG